MPGGARSTAHSSTKAAPAREVQNTPRYFRLSRKLASSGPAVSSGATSRHSRSPRSSRNSVVPHNRASSASVNGPPRSKKRGSAICRIRARPALSPSCLGGGDGGAGRSGGGRSGGGGRGGRSGLRAGGGRRRCDKVDV